MDNYALVSLLHNDLTQLYQLYSKDEKAVTQPVSTQKQPRHVYQKALEVLGKINRLRVIKGLGPVATPHYPVRLITPDEVYGLVKHVRNELHLLIPEDQRKNRTTPVIHKNIVPGDVYSSLQWASLRIDPLLGVRGYTPNEVYQLAEYIVEQIRFLRLSQNLAEIRKKPAKTSGKHPNHALKAAIDLQQKVFQAQINLWMPLPEKPPEIPHRVISPTDVYDALQVILAELQRMKYRLGVNREIPYPALKTNKTPDDVIQLLVYASNLIPSFNSERAIRQYDNNQLDKTPDDSFRVASEVLHMLTELNKARGITVRAEHEEIYQDITPRHAYQAALHNVRRTNELRAMSGYIPGNTPSLPLRTITPTDIYEITSRLKQEIEIFFASTGFNYTTKHQDTFFGKKPEDIFILMRAIHEQLNALSGADTVGANPIIAEADDIIATLKNIHQHLSFELPEFPEKKEENAHLILSKPGIHKKSIQLLNLTDQVREKAGSFAQVAPGYSDPGKSSYAAIYANMSQIHDELIAIKPHIGIFSVHRKPSTISAEKSDEEKALQKLNDRLQLIEIYLKNLLNPGH
ncbi:hypothetical protein [Oceanospirillum sediminis]|nr:hypothetical protein [Oceanospirillum sediminis]